MEQPQSDEFRSAQSHSDTFVAGTDGERGRRLLRKQPSERNEEVILLGLPENTSEVDIYNLLSSTGVQSESIIKVTRILDRHTGLCRGHAFVVFVNLQRAIDFVESNFPSIIFDGGFDSASAIRRIRIDYSHASTDVDTIDQGWICEKCDFENHRKQKFCYSCRNPGPLITSGKPHMPLRPHNDGTRDIFSHPSQLVLIRGLLPTTSPDTLLRTLYYLSPNAVRRVIFLRDRPDLPELQTEPDNDEMPSQPSSWGFAFVEFRDALSATQAVREVLNPRRYERGFRVEDQVVSISFANGASFMVLEQGSDSEENCAARGPISADLRSPTDRLKVIYWDHHAILSEQYETRYDDKSQACNSTAEEHLLSCWAPLGQTPNIIAQDNAPEDVLKDRATKKKIADRTASKRMASNITKWNQKSAELTDLVPLTKSKPAKSAKANELEDTDPPTPQKITSYLHPEKSACLLCMRKFRAAVTATRHESDSDLHKRKLSDERSRQLGGQRVQRVIARMGSLSGDRYRDRAAERRTIYQQANSLSNLRSENGPSGKKDVVDARGSPTPRISTIDSNNVGNIMLQKMGWMSGQGLGSEGSGRTEPVNADIYQNGAGLGTARSQVLGSTSLDHQRNIAMARYQRDAP